jgi:SAM-dependent methyltransferase
LPEELGRFDGQALDIVDLGCGNGEHLEALRDLGHRVVGMDRDDQAIQVARAKGLDVHKGVAEDLPGAIRGRRFDAVLMIHMLEHCLDFRRALRSAASLLTPGGWLVVETPNNQAIGLRRAGTGWLWLDPPRHVNLFTEHSLALACTRAGLSVTRVAYAGYFRQFTRQWMESERAIRHRLGLARPWTGFGLFSALSLLAGTAWAAPCRRYDSVRIVARASLGVRPRERSIASRRGAARAEVPGRWASGARDARPPLVPVEAGRSPLSPAPGSPPPPA